MALLRLVAQADKKLLRAETAASASGVSLDEMLGVFSELQRRDLVSYTLQTGLTITEQGSALLFEMDEYGNFQVDVEGTVETHNVFDYLKPDEVEKLGGLQEGIDFLREKLTSLVEMSPKVSTFGNRSVGSRMPAQVYMTGTVTTPKRVEKLKRLARERARTRDRLRQLAQESGSPPRRPLRTLRD